MRFLLLFLSLGILLQCTEKVATFEPSIAPEDLEAYLAEISSDHYLGRKPFTEGEERTVDYLVKELKRIGVQPGNKGSYIQEVPMVEITGTPDPEMIFKSTKGNFDLELGEEFVSFTERIQEDIDVKNSEVIFCGFGVTAPEYGWNDFAGMDVKGKTIIVLVNDPGYGGEDDEFFKGNTMTYYGRWTYKYEEAERQGAEAVLIVHETQSAGYPWFVVSSSWGGGQLNLRPPDGNMGKAAIQGWISLDATKRMFEAQGLDLGAEIRKARTPDFKPFSLGYTMSHSITNTFKEDVSKNVVGMVKGSTRPDEAILYSAHWDHLGVGKVVNGDSIYNGALDNGSGLSCVLSIAKNFAEAPQPERSVAFLFVTAEEQGLLGSQYYAENPIFPVELSVANLNMDGLAAIGPMKYLTITGMGHSDMDDYAAEAAAAQGRQILADPEPEKGYFFRSDHFNFAKVGIPALYAEGGKEHLEKGEDYVQEKRDQYTMDRYHKPQDEFVPEDWDLRGIAQDAELYFNIGYRLANESTFPQWKDGSEFKVARGLPTKN